MIQRKQSIWLLLAALFSAGVLFFDLFRIHTVVNGTETIVPYTTSQHFPLLIIAIVMILLPLVTVFMFKDRKRQSRMSGAGIIAVLAFMGMVLTHAKADAPSTITYWIGSVLPVVSIVFLIMAISGIRKDEKMVRSMDRLR